MRPSLQRAKRLNLEAIEHLRLAQGLTVERLAAKVGVDVRTLKRWLSGGNAFVENIALIAQVFHVAPDVLIVTDHAPQRPEPVRNVTTFRLELSITGTIASPDQARALAELPPTVAAELERLGIRITANDARLSIENRTDENRRRMVVIYGILENGRPCWMYAAVRPSMYTLFLRAMDEQVVNVHDFGIFGEIVVSGWDVPPSVEIIRKVHELYQIADASAMDEQRRVAASFARIPLPTRPRSAQ